MNGHFTSIWDRWVKEDLCICTMLCLPPCPSIDEPDGESHVAVIVVCVIVVLLSAGAIVIAIAAVFYVKKKKRVKRVK